MARHIPSWLAPLLVYSALAVGLTWPLATQWTTYLPGGAHKDGLEDAYQNIWNLWWTTEALRQPTNPLITDRFFYPERPTLYYHTLSPANTLLVAPMTMLWGPIAGFNAVAFFSFVAGGLGAWALVRDRTRSAAGALLAGIIYAWSPFHLAALAEDGQLQIVALQWLPWYILFLLRALERGERRNMLWAGIFLVLTAWTDWYYTLYLTLFTAGYAGWRLAQNLCDWSVCRVLLARLSIIGAITTMGAAPLVVPMLIEAARYTYMNDYTLTDPARLSADLLAYLTPSQLHPWWGDAPWAWGVPYGLNRRFYLGVVALTLALIGVWRWREARRWGIAALLFGVLSLGPTLRVAGVDTGVPLPYQLLANLPVVQLTRQPDRFNVMVTLALALVAAFGVRSLADWLNRTARGSFPSADAGTAVQLGLVAVLGILLIIDYLPVPLVTRRLYTPPFLAALPHTDDGALIEYPFHVALPYRDAERMLFQTVHQRPISGGYHSRLYPQPQLGLPVLRDLRAGQLESDIVVEQGDWREALQTLNYAYIIGYKQQLLGPRNLQPAEEEDFKQLVNAGLNVAGPDYEDQWLIAYHVPAAAPRPVVQIREGWGAVEENASGMRYRWLAEEAALGLFVPAAGRYRLSFQAQPAGGARRLALEWAETRLEVELPDEQRRYTLLLQLPAGRTIMTLRSLDPPTTGDALEGNGDLRPISVRIAALFLE